MARQSLRMMTQQTDAGQEIQYGGPDAHSCATYCASQGCTQQDFRGARGPKLPSFEEGKDNIDAYIERFVRYASAQRWPQEQWGANLGALLKGRALDVFTRLSVEDSLNFDTLKKALLRRFEKTEEGFRKSFRSERPDPGETFGQFGTRLDGYLKKWVEMTNTQKTYDGLKDLMVRDQFLHCCGKDLALFLKERVPKTMEEMARFADQFAEARGTKTNVMMARSVKYVDKQHSSTSDPKTTDKKENNTTKKPVCFKCLQPGHKSFECPNKKTGHRVAGMTGTTYDTTDSSKDRTLATGKGKRKGLRRKFDSGSSCAVDTDTPELSESCNADLSAVTNMPVVRGCIGDHFVTVLRDSGCSGVVVRKSLVKPSQMTERNQTCSLADGSRIEVPIAEVEIDTPYLTGSVKAWVLDTPLYDLIIGNVEGAKPPDQPDGNWERKEESLQAVETRAQCLRREQGYRQLKVPQMLEDLGDVENLKKEQKGDESLSKMRKLAEEENVVERDDGGKSIVYYHKGLLYRKFHSPRISNGKTFRQLIVPRKFRQTKLKLAHDSIMAGHQGAKRTASRVMTEFFWPGLQSDVVRYCRSCDVCQRTVPKGRVTKAPLGSMDYEVDMAGKKKTFHINMLKKYFEKDPGKIGNLGGVGVLCGVTAAVVHEDELEQECHRELEAFPMRTGKEGIGDVHVFEHITTEQRREVDELLSEFNDVLTDKPGRTNLASHDIFTTTEDPVRVRPYPLPFHTKSVIKEEVDSMLEMDVIEPSTSPYSAPVVMVKKKDGSNRFCIDFRSLNKVTVFDAEPMPNTEDIFARLAGCFYFSKLDLTKGYWQVPMSERAKEMTAFSTHYGLFQFKVMPFGLVNAPATFSRLMRKLLMGMANVENFIDDILMYTKTWTEHLETLRELFLRLRKAGLTARPTKCFLAHRSLPCLGHIVGEQGLLPEPEKIKAILDAPRPETKKQVRSFLGLAGFYRRFIPNFSAVAVPLIEFTKKGANHKVVWEDSQEKAFNVLKKLLTSQPILKLPNVNEDFILRTDASDRGIGAVLLQEEHGEKLPVAYASRKRMPGDCLGDSEI
ncbi:LOW QUALITY PROTEIN: uncharacterized protein [Argopecten irradians]|uniref:LOW QUALITY PROTEIN: uncharacterized protein n=1 Tax=Argopecten irradians TaxID=31199 RepID=UPI00370F94E9